MEKNRNFIKGKKQHTQFFGQIAKEANLQPKLWSLNYFRYYVPISHFYLHSNNYHWQQFILPIKTHFLLVDSTIFDIFFSSIFLPFLPYFFFFSSCDTQNNLKTRYEKRTMNQEWRKIGNMLLWSLIDCALLFLHSSQ